MNPKKEHHVHVVGTGTIGEPLIGLLCSLQDDLGIKEVSFSKKSALLNDRSKVLAMMRRGAKLCAESSQADNFRKLGMEPSYSVEEAFKRASVIIDCTPSGKGIENKNTFYKQYEKTCKGFIAQGSEFGFGKMYAVGINDEALIAGKDKYIQVVSCNTHNLSALIKTLGLDAAGKSHIVDGRFVCLRRANDISQDKSYVPSPTVDEHDDEQFGTHHAHDAYHLFQTLGLELKNLFSSSLKTNTQYMHTVWFNITLDHDITKEQVLEKFKANPYISLTHKDSANSVFSFGRDHGHYGRILNQTVVVIPSLTVHNKRQVVGFCFTPQDGNALVSSVAATTFFLYPNQYKELMSCITRHFFPEV
jgi:glyceraldehyde-3-phosphate dehydrogenase (NAD(P))